MHGDDRADEVVAVAAAHRLIDVGPLVRSDGVAVPCGDVAVEVVGQVVGVAEAVGDLLVDSVARSRRVLVDPQTPQPLLDGTHDEVTRGVVHLLDEPLALLVDLECALRELEAAEAGGLVGRLGGDHLFALGVEKLDGCEKVLREADPGAPGGARGGPAGADLGDGLGHDRSPVVCHVAMWWTPARPMA